MPQLPPASIYTSPYLSVVTHTMRMAVLGLLDDSTINLDHSTITLDNRICRAFTSHLMRNYLRDGPRRADWRLDVCWPFLTLRFTGMSSSGGASSRGKVERWLPVFLLPSPTFLDPDIYIRCPQGLRASWTQSSEFDASMTRWWGGGIYTTGYSSSRSRGKHVSTRIYTICIYCSSIYFNPLSFLFMKN